MYAFSISSYDHDGYGIFSHFHLLSENTRKIPSTRNIETVYLPNFRIHLVYGCKCFVNKICLTEIIFQFNIFEKENN